jgi:hypothetical protein
VDDTQDKNGTSTEFGVGVRDLVIDRTGQDRAVASFRQLHRSKAGLRATAKRLDLVMEAGRWRIATETVR